MDDLISRAALDAIFGCFNVMESKGIDMTVARTIVKGVLDGVPAVDAVPVIRCKDCMYFRPWRHDRGEDSRCEFWNTEMGTEDYCSQAIYLNNGRDDDAAD